MLTRKRTVLLLPAFCGNLLDVVIRQRVDTVLSNVAFLEPGFLGVDATYEIPTPGMETEMRGNTFFPTWSPMESTTMSGF